MEDRVTETISNAAVSGLILILPALYPACSLTHIYIQESPVSESELANISGTKECTFVESEDRDMETNSEAAVRELIHIVEILTFPDAHLNPEIVWKLPGGHSYNSTVYPGHRETDLKGVAVCSSFHSGSIDTRGSWSCAENRRSMRRGMRGL